MRFKDVRIHCQGVNDFQVWVDGEDITADINYICFEAGTEGFPHLTIRAPIIDMEEP